MCSYVPVRKPIHSRDINYYFISYDDSLRFKNYLVWCTILINDKKCLKIPSYSFVYDLSYWHQRVGIVYKPPTIPSYMTCLIDINVLSSFTNLWLFLRIWLVLLISTCWHRLQTSDYSFVYDLSYWHQRVDIVYKPLTIPSYMICLIDIKVLTSFTNLWLFLRIWFVLLTSTCWHRLQTSVLVTL
jgi:hypothetical protein